MIDEMQRVPRLDLVEERHVLESVRRDERATRLVQMTVPVQGERHVRVIHFQLSIRLEGDERLIAVDQPVREQDADWVGRSFQTEWMVEVRVNVDWVRGVHDLVGPEAELVDELVAGDLSHRKQQIGILKQRAEQLRLPRRARPGEQFVRSRVLVVDVADWFA